MAKMIPSVISPDVKSRAERKIFEWFRDAPNTSDWVVLHFLGISNHIKLIHGEADFVVLAPKMGMFVLEVKGGRVTRENGIRTFTNRCGEKSTKTRGPFEQAWDGVHSIVDDLRSRLDPAHQKIEHIFYGIGVMFPDIRYKANGPDEEQWQVFDCNDGEDVYNYILRLFDGASKKWKETYGFKVGGNMLPTKEDVDYIASLLRGDFDRAVAMSVNIRCSEEALIKLTDEQYRCIDQLDGNKRCLIEGGAGTGKTLLAVKEAQKAVASGIRVALFCFNRNLSEWLNMRFEDVPDNLTPEFIGTFPSYMSKICRKGNIEFDNVDDLGEFYAELLPRGASMALDKLDDEKFDKIIVDEAQDLINDSYLDVLDKCLRGGLSKGRWTFMGDFSQQAIYNDKKLTGDEMKELIEERAPFAGFRLTVNCRNTRPICDEISLITGFQAPGDVLSEVEGTPVRYITYSDQNDEKKKLRDTVKKLIKDNIPPEKITVLSPVKRENSVVSKIEDITINDYDPKAAENSEVTFCTVQSFKGLENTVIILADIDSLKNRQLMYVALSRARSGLYIIGSEQALGEYEEFIKNRAEKDGRLKEKQGTVV